MRNESSHPVENNPFNRISFRRWFRAETYTAVGASGNLAVALTSISITHSAAAAGQVAAGTSIAGALASLAGGHFGDHLSRRRMLNLAISIAALADVVILVCLKNYNAKISNLTVTSLFISSVLISEAAVQFSEPILDASLKKIITPEEFPKAANAAQARSSIISIAGEPLSGFLYSLSKSIPFIFKFLCGMGFLFSLKKIPEKLGPERIEKRSKNRVNLYRSYLEASKLIYERKSILAFIIATPLINILVFSGMRWCVYGLSARGSSGSTIGMVTSGFALGTLIGSLLSNRVYERISNRHIVIWGLSMMTVSFSVLILSKENIYYMFANSFICMLPSPALNSVIFSYIFSDTPEKMQSRVIAIFIFVSSLSSAAASWGSGIAVESNSVEILGLCVAACGTLGVTLVASPLTRPLNT